jgi:hypothetical protein
MASRYDQSINYWGETWGNRSHVVVAINGYFFGSPQEPAGVPWSGMVQSGWYAKRFTEISGDAGFTWMLDGDAFIGKCVYHRSDKNDIYFPSAGYDPNIDAINVARNDSGDELILYTPQYDATTRTLENGPTPRAEILIELSRPGLLISDPAFIQGTIRGIRKNNGSTPIPFDHVVLAAWGNVGDALVNRINSDTIQVGDEVRLTQEVKDCLADTQHDWTKTYSSIGGDYHFLRSGVYYAPSNPDATWPNSRTVVAYNASYVYFIVVDAFDPGVSVGITIPELNNFIRNNLAATDAVSLDSGTSSTMVVNGQVVNNTYCNYTRQCGTQNRIEITPSRLNQPESGSAIEWSPLDNQAYVGNGLMMVVVEPRAVSGAFVGIQTVTAAAETSLRLGPGTNYAPLTTIYPGAQGVIQVHSLDGVLAKGSCWWKVAFGGNIGWVSEATLRARALSPLLPVLGDLMTYLPFIEKANIQYITCSAS